jgi:hypothetical protein
MSQRGLPSAPAADHAASGDSKNRSENAAASSSAPLTTSRRRNAVLTIQSELRRLQAGSLNEALKLL